MDCELEPKAEQEETSLKKRCSESLKSNSASSCQEIAAALDLSSASGRLRRESLCQEGQLTRQTFVPILANQTKSVLDNLVLIPDQSRPSVITLTPSRIPRTSTPSNSPKVPHLTPRSCELRESSHLQQPQHSECSELSSISGDVFFDSEGHSLSKSIKPLPLLKPPVLEINTMDNEAKEINGKYRKLLRKIRNFSVNDLNEVSIKNYDKYMEQLNEIFDNLIDSIESFCEDFKVELGNEREKEWLCHRDKIESDVRSYKNSMEVRLAELQRNSSIPGNTSSVSLQAEQLQLMKEQTNLSKRAHSERQEQLEESKRDEELKQKTSATARAKAKCEAVIADANELKEELNAVDPSDWETESDLAIERACLKIKSWRKSLDKITLMFREAKDIVAGNDIPEYDVKLVDAEYLLDDVNNCFKEAYTSLMEQDNERELYTFDSVNKDLIKLPTFGGKEGEDFKDFKDKVKKAFMQNRVTKADKLDKLRSCLHGNALGLVPISLTGNIDKAWEALDNAYGDPVRLLSFKMNALRELGPMPKQNSKGGFNAIAEWYLKIEGILKEILDLGRTSDELGREAFHPTAFRDLYAMFPPHISGKLRKRPGEADVKMELIIEKISELRSDAQQNQQ